MGVYIWWERDFFKSYGKGFILEVGRRGICFVSSRFLLFRCGVYIRCEFVCRVFMLFILDLLWIEGDRE